MSSRFTMALAAAGIAGVLFSMGIVFGLGLLSSTEKIQANGQSPYLAKVEGTADRARRVEDDQRTLSPIYPSAPKVAGDDSAPAAQTATTDGSAKNESKSEPATKLDQAKQALTQPAPKAEASATAPPQAATTTGSAETDAKPVPTPVTASAAPPANATPIPNASANSCDVSACAAAYRSFRESDCTYQPFDGPRRACVNPPAQTQASTQPAPQVSPQASSPPRQRTPVNAAAPPRPPANIDDVADEVRRLTREDGVYPPPSMRGEQRLIVIER
jgi:hypothetical protein